MNLIETTAFLTWLSQTDGRIQVTEPNVQVWANSLAPVSVEDVREAVMEHYRTNDGVMPSPAGVRRSALAARDRVGALQSALTAGPVVPNLNYDAYVKRVERPEYQAEFERARREGNASRAYETALRETGSDQAARAAALLARQS